MKTILVIPPLKYNCNFWGALRTAEAFGVTELCFIGYINLNRIPKGSMKTYKHIKVSNFNTVEECMDYLISKNIKIISIENSDNSILLNRFIFPANIALVMGHERLGVPDYILNRTIALKIPQFGLVKCLNTTVSISIVLYERFKQKLKI